jgi:hypothetical protein
MMSSTDSGSAPEGADAQYYRLSDDRLKCSTSLIEDFIKQVKDYTRRNGPKDVLAAIQPAFFTEDHWCNDARERCMRNLKSLVNSHQNLPPSDLTGKDRQCLDIPLNIERATQAVLCANPAHNEALKELDRIQTLHQRGMDLAARLCLSPFTLGEAQKALDNAFHDNSTVPIEDLRKALVLKARHAIVDFIRPYVATELTCRVVSSLFDHPNPITGSITEDFALAVQFTNRWAYIGPFDRTHIKDDFDAFALALYTEVTTLPASSRDLHYVKFPLDLAHTNTLAANTLAANTFAKFDTNSHTKFLSLNDDNLPRLITIITETDDENEDNLPDVIGQEEGTCTVL